MLELHKSKMKPNQSQKNISKEWQTRKLDSMFTVRRGGSPRPIESYITNRADGLNWLKIGDIDVGAKYITKTSSKILKEGLSRTTLVKKGDFILSNSMSFGRPYIMGIDSCIHDGWLTFQDIKTNILDRDFLYYLLSQSKTQAIFTSISAGSGVQNLKKETVSGVVLSIPPLPEQNRIVAVLETWDKAIENLNKKIEIKKQIKKGLMQDLLTGKKRLSGFKEKWETKTLGDVSDFINGYTFKSGNYVDGGKYKIITIANVQDGFMFIDEPKTINELPENIGKEQILKKGDILISMTGNVGRVCVVNSDNCLLNQRVGKIMTKDINKELLYLFLYDRRFLYQMIGSAQGGAQANLSTEDIKEYIFDLPKTKEEQNAVAEILTTADKEITELEKKLSIIKDQKKFLLNNLITGAIRTPVNMQLYGKIV